MACDTNRIHEGPVIWVVHDFIKSAAAVLNARTFLFGLSHTLQEVILMSYCKVLKYLFTT